MVVQTNPLTSVAAKSGLGASLARIVFYAQSAAGGQTYYFTHDPERTNTRIAYIQMLESGISITAINLPSLWKVCTATLPEKFASITQSLRSPLLSQRRSRLSSEGVSFPSTGDSVQMTDVKGQTSMEPLYPPPTLKSGLGHSVTIHAMKEHRGEEP